MSRGSDDPLKFNIGGIYQSQANLNSLQFGLNLLKYNIYVGGWYKTTMTGVVNSAVALVAGYRYTFYEDMSLKFMYSYDLQVSGALQGTGGAHEISLILEFDKLSIFGGGGGGSFMPGGAGGRRGGTIPRTPRTANARRRGDPDARGLRPRSGLVPLDRPTREPGSPESLCAVSRCWLFLR